MTPAEAGRALFTQKTEAALNALSAMFPGQFVALVIVGTNPNDETENLAQLKMNVEDGVPFAEHIKMMCENIISGVEPVDLTDTVGGMQ